MCWQRFLCGGLALIVITFVVLLPLFILMRADEDVLWPWAAALIPLWLADALYAALSLFRLVAATRTATGDETPPAPAGSVCSAAISVLTMLCVLASHVLLVLRLSRPDDAAGERALTFTLALSLLAAALLPSALGATWQLLRACAHRLCPQRTPDVPPPSLAQMAPPAARLASCVLLAATLGLVGAKSDGWLDVSWWVPRPEQCASSA